MEGGGVCGGKDFWKKYVEFRVEIRVGVMDILYITNNNNN